MVEYEQKTVFPRIIDNSLLKQLRRCPQHALRSRLQGLRPIKDGSIDLHFGGAFAKGVEAGRRAFFERHDSAHSARECAVEVAVDAYRKETPVIPARSNKTLERLLAALAHYWQAWPLGEDGLTPIAGGIEYAFAKKLPFVHPDDGKQLMYGGRCDMVAKNESGGLVVVDEKTAGSFSDAWLMQWDMDAQMTGYIWDVQDFCPQGELPHALIRGVSIGKTEIGHTLAPVFRTEFQVELWYAQMLRDVQRLLDLYADGIWDRFFGNACVEYGRPCEYAPLCSGPSSNQLIAQSYKVEFWNPHAEGFQGNEKPAQPQRTFDY